MAAITAASGLRAGRRRAHGVGVFLLGALAFWAMIALGAVAARAQGDDALGGRYIGIDQAAGWTLELTAAPGGFLGRFVDENGAATEFSAEGDDRLAEAEVAFADGGAYFRLAPRPIGLMLGWVPVDTNGQLVVEQSATFPFLREGVELPKAPERFAAPPANDQTSFDAVAFVESYEFWTPEEVGRAYNGLTEKARALIKLYAPLHTDVLWKLCQARSTPDGLALALEGQAIDCPQLLEAIARAQRAGKFGRYKADLEPVRDDLLAALRCATGVERKRDCVEVSKATSQRAIALETAATVVARY